MFPKPLILRLGEISDWWQKSDFLERLSVDVNFFETFSNGPSLKKKSVANRQKKVRLIPKAVKTEKTLPAERGASSLRTQGAP